MEFIHAHLAAILVGGTFVNGMLTMDAIQDSRWGWALVHTLIGIGCGAYLS